MRAPAALLLALMVAPLAAAPTAASGAQAELRVGGTAHWQGPLDAEVPGGSVVLDDRLGTAPATYTLAATALRLEAHYANWTVVRPSRQGPAAALAQATQPQLAERDWSEAAATLAFTPAAGVRSLRFLGPATLRAHGNDSRLLADGDPAASLQDRRVVEPGLPRAWYPPPGLRLEGARNASFAGDVLLVAHGYRVATATRTLDTGLAERVVAALPDGSQVVQVSQVVLVAHARVQGTVQNPAVYGLRAQLAGTGDLFLTAASGQGEVNGTALPATAASFQLAGPLSASADYTQQPSAWTVASPAPRLVASDTAVYAGHRGAPDPLLVAGGVGLLALLAVAAGWLLRLPHATLRNVAKPLANPTRVRVLRAVGEHPGATLPDLQRLVGAKRSTLRFHLRVLARSHLVDVHRRGGSEHYLLNSGHYRIVVGPPAAPARAPDVLAAARHPARRALLDALQAAPAPLTAAALAARLGAAGNPLSRNLAGHHLRVLAEAGAVARLPGGAWQPAVDLAHIRSVQRRELLAEGRRADLLALAAEHPDATAAEQLRLAVARGLGWRAAAASLRELHAFGLLDRNPQGGYRARASA